MPIFSDDDEFSDNDQDNGSNDADQANKSGNDLPKTSPKPNNGAEVILIDDDVLSDDSEDEPKDPYQIQQELTMLFAESKNFPREIPIAPETFTSNLPFALKHPLTHRRVMLQPGAPMSVLVVDKYPKSAVRSSTNVENISSSRINSAEKQPDTTTSSSENVNSISSSSTSSIEKKPAEIEIINSFKPLDDKTSQLPTIEMSFSMRNPPRTISDMMNTTLGDTEEIEVLQTNIINANDSQDNVQLIESDDDIICMEDNPCSPIDYTPRENPYDYCYNAIVPPSTSTGGNASDNTVILLD